MALSYNKIEWDFQNFDKKVTKADVKNSKFKIEYPNVCILWLREHFIKSYT